MWQFLRQLFANHGPAARVVEANFIQVSVSLAGFGTKPKRSARPESFIAKSRREGLLIGAPIFSCGIDSIFKLFSF